VDADAGLACCVAVGADVFAGTDDARMLRIDAGGGIEHLRGFDEVAGRAGWHAGRALVDGQWLGPPLGVRSIAATADGGVLLANVHVGGIPRSTDGGRTWHPTIDIDADVHDVCAHPQDPRVAIAAAAIGFCASRDAGASWRVETRGLHASYCSAVTFAGGAAVVAASADHFAPQGAIYRAALAGDPPLEKVTGGLPEWLGGIADTACLTGTAAALVVADRRGDVYRSTNATRAFTRIAVGLPAPSAVLVV
jgi:hypothetical protein